MKQLLRRLKGMMLRHMHGMITCEEFEQFILDYFEDNLAPRQRRIFEMHLKLCRECREYLAAYRRSIEMGVAVLKSDSGALSIDVPEDLIAAIMDARKQ